MEGGGREEHSACRPKKKILQLAYTSRKYEVVSIWNEEEGNNHSNNQ